jgi:hypothetical protein
MILHSFNMGDVEDPYLYAGFPIAEWQQTEQGKWIMENVVGEPTFHITPDMDNYGYRVVITGDLNPEAATYFTLKYK